MKPSTNSKVHFPIITKATGKYVYDINGKKYIDFTGSNLTTVLGYRPRKSVVPNFPGVSSAEAELNKLLHDRTGTNYFRYYPNGSDAVNNAIRYARSLYGADASVYYLGYAGSHDTYANTIKGYTGSGIPEKYSYQIDLEKIKRYYKKTKGIDITNANIAEKTGHYLRNDKIDILVFESRYARISCNIKSKIRICDHLKNGVIALYKDCWKPYAMDAEIIGLPQADFHCLGKSIFNGSSGAILTGKDEYMERIDEVYYSNTFGCNNDMMIEAIRTIKDFEKVKTKYFKLYDYAKQVLPAWTSLSPDQIKAFQKHGVLYNGYWQCQIQHTKKDIDNLRKLIDIIITK
jgi:4-aminobutyrate aminotransferase-like enzyme